MELRSAIKTIWIALIGSVIGWSFAIADDTQERWMLMSRHGECEEINSLKEQLKREFGTFVEIQKKEKIQSVKRLEIK